MRDKRIPGSMVETNELSERDIPTSNIDLHYAHCSRNLLKCTICGDMIPKKQVDEHYKESHAPGIQIYGDPLVFNLVLSYDMQLDYQELNCMKSLLRRAGKALVNLFASMNSNQIYRGVDCSLCSETVEREFWSTHKSEKCQQRIVTCEYCEFPLPVVDLRKHQDICGNRTEYCDICNKYVRLCERVDHEMRLHRISDETAESSRNTRPSEGEERVNRRAQDPSKRRIYFTIAITGIAVLIGSLFLQKKENVEKA